MSRRTKPASAPCEECCGHGYHARQVIGSVTPRPKGFRGIEIERCDICQSCKNDDHASLKFVSGLECHDRHALQELAEILNKPSLSIVLRAILDREEGVRS